MCTPILYTNNLNDSALAIQRISYTNDIEEEFVTLKRGNSYNLIVKLSPGIIITRPILSGGINISGKYISFQKDGDLKSKGYICTDATENYFSNDKEIESLNIKLSVISQSPIMTCVVTLSLKDGNSAEMEGTEYLNISFKVNIVT